MGDPAKIPPDGFTYPLALAVFLSIEYDTRTELPDTAQPFPDERTGLFKGRAGRTGRWSPQGEKTVERRRGGKVGRGGVA